MITTDETPARDEPDDEPASLAELLEGFERPIEQNESSTMWMD